MYKHICICMYIYMYMYICTYIYIYIRRNMYIYTYMICITCIFYNIYIHIIILYHIMLYYIILYYMFICCSKLFICGPCTLHAALCMYTMTTSSLLASMTPQTYAPTAWASPGSLTRSQISLSCEVFFPCYCNYCSSCSYCSDAAI